MFPDDLLGLCEGAERRWPSLSPSKLWRTRAAQLHLFAAARMVDVPGVDGRLPGGSLMFKMSSQESCAAALERELCLWLS